MATVVRKWSFPLSIDKIKQAMKEQPKKVTDSEKYGKTLWVDGAEFEDGGVSLSVYNSETKDRIRISNGKLEEGQNNKPEPAGLLDELDI